MVFRLTIFGVLIFALAAVLVFAYSLMNESKVSSQQQNTAPPPPTEQILVASGPLQGGTLLQPAGIASASVLVKTAPQGVIIDTPDNRATLTGSMLRVPLAAQQPILDTAVIHPGDHGFLAAVLSPGMRAVTISVDAVTGADGLIWPGDDVDVLLTQTIPGAPDSKSIAVEQVLSNVRVIATGAELIKDPNAGADGGQSAKTVTLEVTPDQAARCIVAGTLGKLSLILHSAQGVDNAAKAAPKNTAAPSVPLTVWSGDVSPALTNAVPQNSQMTTVNVLTPNGSGEFKF
ncbi:Flp pilus assembly protein CpaB [Acidocella sp.]|uniref:Flp pilus assembly protein CpaB n=1 Tax=Acidocella sp. TaxID=50710 RepID=UPI002639E9A3|nr:Flp pilus assembly protein CpaB [Acidocella sp.]